MARSAAESSLTAEVTQPQVGVFRNFTHDPTAGLVLARLWLLPGFEWRAPDDSLLHVMGMAQLQPSDDRPEAGSDTPESPRTVADLRDWVRDHVQLSLIHI